MRSPTISGAAGWRLAHFVVLLGVAWVVMLLTHEGGHLLGGALCGARLLDFDLVPWRMPYSLHSPDPCPQVTLWGGPLAGVCVPVFVAWGVRRAWVWFIADFCLLANGVYLAVAWLSGDRFLDTARLLDAGTHPFWIGFYCVLTIGTGYPRFRSDCVKLLAG